MLWRTSLVRPENSLSHIFNESFGPVCENQVPKTTTTDEADDRLARCEQRIGYQFKDQSLLKRSLTHSSCAGTRLECNERMEFLGDAVLGMVICEFLYNNFPERREGQLTQQKSHLVSRSVCAVAGARLGVEELIFVGTGMQSIPDSLKAALIESIIAGIYLDGGYEPAQQFILTAFQPELDNCEELDTDNYKSLLQEETQKVGKLTPSYVIVDHRGPDHAREFLVAVEIGERRFEPAWGKSKKEAEQKAAMIAMNVINDDQANNDNEVERSGALASGTSNPTE